MGGFSMDPAVGAFLQSLSNAGLSTGQINTLAAVQSDPGAWGTLYNSFTGTGPKQQQQMQQQTQDTSGTIASVGSLLRNYGLEELTPLVDGYIRNGMTWDEIQVQLYDTKTKAGKVFDKRFPAIQLRRQSGLAPISPEEYVNYERQARQLMQSAGLPKGFYDGRDDYTNLLVKDVSLTELADRVNQGYAEVANAPAEIRQAFSNFFGASGDAALASYFLDAKKAMPVLDKAVRDAQIGGAGLQFGIDLALNRVEQIQGTGATYDSARQAFDQLSGLKPLFDETISETRDLTAQGEGVDAIFGLDAGAAKTDLQKRLETRNAEFGGSGGAASGQQGVYGLGAAK